jgi:hypothetical protein
MPTIATNTTTPAEEAGTWLCLDSQPIGVDAMLPFVSD